MRIIAGAARGMRLGPVPPGVRPVSDRAREGVFSSLGEAVAGARVLDLFAGSGALGLEALSRGAVSATFVERDRTAAAAIRDNLVRTQLGPGDVVIAEARRFLERRREREAEFDLVFLDPPYEYGPPGLDEVLAAVGRAVTAAGPWTVVLTRANRSSTHVIPVDWAAARRLRYGDSLVFLYREV